LKAARAAGIFAVSKPIGYETMDAISAAPHPERIRVLRAMTSEPRPSEALSPATLRALPIFAATRPSALEVIARAAMQRHVTRGTQVIREGEQTDFVYLVLSGNLNVMVSNPEGREAILSILGPGEMFGEMGVLDDEARSATVVAVSAGTLVAITKSDFKHHLRENFDVALYVMRKLVQRLRAADRRIESLALLDVSGRVVRLLRDIAEAATGEQIITRRVSRQEIAKMVGASREMVSRVLKDLQARGLIEEEEDGRIVLHELSVR
jgi:CRP/FNR family cyclic AMP-dependent transcriptional regulator